MCSDCEEPPEGYYDSPLSLRERFVRRLRDRLRAWRHRNDGPYSDEPPF